MSSKLGSCEDRGSLTVQELTQNIPTRDVLSQARVMCYVRAVATRAQECLRGIRNQHFMAGSKPGRAFIRDNSKHVHVGKTRKNTLTPGDWEKRGQCSILLGSRGSFPSGFHFTAIGGRDASSFGACRERLGSPSVGLSVRPVYSCCSQLQLCLGTGENVC